MIKLPLQDADNPTWDNRSKVIIDNLKKQILNQEKQGRILFSEHPVAAINADSPDVRDPEHLLYTMASQPAFDGDNSIPWAEIRGEEYRDTLRRALEKGGRRTGSGAEDGTHKALGAYLLSRTYLPSRKSVNRSIG